MPVFYLVLYLYAGQPAIVPNTYTNYGDCVAAGKYVLRDIRSRSRYALGQFVCVPWGSDNLREKLEELKNGKEI